MLGSLPNLGLGRNELFISELQVDILNIEHLRTQIYALLLRLFAPLLVAGYGIASPNRRLHRSIV